MAKNATSNFPIFLPGLTSSTNFLFDRRKNNGKNCIVSNTVNWGNANC
ncbi:hypothetical protein CMALT394_530005 [Carnobacterium maltaromaticum]|nr:hypothetical protein CMALT394_530005 [Carnobacterium maltaromaticum]